MWHGRPAGRLHFRSEFVNTGMVAAGLGIQPMGMGMGMNPGIMGQQMGMNPGINMGGLNMNPNMRTGMW